jgi:hypothetical protein
VNWRRPSTEGLFVMWSLTGGFLTQPSFGDSFLAFAFRKALYGIIRAIERKGEESRKSHVLRESRLPPFWTSEGVRTSFGGEI